jgi:hypothetical protein
MAALAKSLGLTVHALDTNIDTPSRESRHRA